MKNTIKGPSWCVVGEEEISHYVENGENNALAVASICGISMQSRKHPWHKAQTEKHCPACVAIVMKRGEVLQDAKEHRLNFLQVVGPEIPLCWIPVDDVKAVCLLLASFRPIDSLRLSQAQVDTVIAHLNEYIDEAIARNNKPNTFSTAMVAEWTKPPEKEEKKKK